MQFLVEDGTGLAGATSYVDIAFADQYFLTFGKTDWATLSEDNKKIALNSASAYADLRFGYRLPGSPVAAGQALALPMRGICDRYGNPVQGVPAAWQRAVCEYALLASKNQLMVAQQSAQSELKKKMVKVGPITTDYEFAVAQQSGQFKSYPQADTIVTTFFGPGTFGAGRVIRG